MPKFGHGGKKGEILSQSSTCVKPSTEAILPFHYMSYEYMSALYVCMYVCMFVCLFRTT